MYTATVTAGFMCAPLECVVQYTIACDGEGDEGERERQ
jgi:hypothetical protein